MSGGCAPKGSGKNQRQRAAYHRHSVSCTFGIFRSPKPLNRNVPPSVRFELAFSEVNRPPVGQAARIKVEVRYRIMGEQIKKAFHRVGQRCGVFPRILDGSFA